MHDDAVSLGIYLPLICNLIIKLNILLFSSSRTEPPDLVGIMRVTDDMIDSLVCPPPPSDPPVMSEEMISGLIVPAPHIFRKLINSK